MTSAVGRVITSTVSREQIDASIRLGLYLPVTYIESREAGAPTYTILVQLTSRLPGENTYLVGYVAEGDKDLRTTGREGVIIEEETGGWQLWRELSYTDLRTRMTAGLKGLISSG